MLQFRSIITTCEDSYHKMLIRDYWANTLSLKAYSFSVSPTSLAVTKGILVSFCFCAALTNMLKFSAYPRLS